MRQRLNWEVLVLAPFALAMWVGSIGRLMGAW